MKKKPIHSRHWLSLVVGAAGLALASAAHSQTPDSYVPATGQLTIPSLVIGSADFLNLVVGVTAQDILINPAPGATSTTAIGDFFDTTNGELSIASVTVGSATYYDPVVQVAGLQSIGSVVGAATYAGGSLTMPAVQVLGGALYTDVSAQIGLGQVRSVGGGMPTVSQNTYDTSTGLLTVPVAQYNGRYYTNVKASVTLGNVTHVGGHQGIDTVIYPFTGIADGANPASTLIQGADGNFYGTTADGGSAGYGTVFRVSPQGTFTLLYTFTSSAGDGAYPYTGLVIDSAGNIYGTTSGGGTSGVGKLGGGTVFRIAPNGTETVLYSFNGNISGSVDGAYPNALVLGSGGGGV